MRSARRAHGSGIMDMDVEYQYETFNGLPVYYGGDVYDAEDMEEYDPLGMARAAVCGGL